MREFGGYLPFEMREGKEYYSGEDVVALNCARNAIVYAVMDGEYTKIYIPFYMCVTVMDALKANNICFGIYHINENFEPIDVQLGETECILYPNYFGLFSESRIRNIVEKYRNVILDNTQAFFAGPVPEAYNVYSCRKFIGVSDGAYVVHEGIGHMEYERDRSCHRMAYLFQCMEEGTNAAYEENLKVEAELCRTPIRKMSAVTQKLLRMADYEMIKKSRIRNYKLIDDFFVSKGRKSITRSKECVPMVYPFLCDDPAKRAELITNKIYVPQWWKYLLDQPGINPFERKLTEGLLPLPIDQRYKEEDIKEMLKVLDHVLGKG